MPQDELHCDLLALLVLHVPLVIVFLVVPEHFAQQIVKMFGISFRTAKKN